MQLYIITYTLLSLSSTILHGVSGEARVALATPHPQRKTTPLCIRLDINGLDVKIKFSWEIAG